MKSLEQPSERVYSLFERTLDAWTAIILRGKVVEDTIVYTGDDYTITFYPELVTTDHPHLDVYDAIAATYTKELRNA
jgi:hypothetical protein